MNEIKLPEFMQTKLSEADKPFYRNANAVNKAEIESAIKAVSELLRKMFNTGDVETYKPLLANYGSGISERALLWLGRQIA